MPEQACLSKFVKKELSKSRGICSATSNESTYTSSLSDFTPSTSVFQAFLQGKYRKKPSNGPETAPFKSFFVFGAAPSPIACPGPGAGSGPPVGNGPR